MKKQAKEAVKSTLLGYRLSIDDGNCDMYYWNEETHGLEAQFKTVYDVAVNTNFKCRCRKDLFACYDGFDICSQKFKDFCNENGYDGLQFIDLPKAKGKYVLRMHLIEPLDQERMEIRYQYPNLKGPGFWGIYRSPRTYLQKQTPLKDGIYRSDVFFGDHFTKHPLIFCGIETMQKMKAVKMTGIYFDKIYDQYPPSKLVDDRLPLGPTPLIPPFEDPGDWSPPSWSMGS